jgi:hypothetical protein
MDATGPPITSDTWRTLLAAAIRAPSPHNVQPWRIHVLGPDQAELRIEKHRTLPAEDVEGSFIILTMGMFIETLRIVAAHHGLALDATPVADLGDYTVARLASRTEAQIPFARLRLRPDAAARPTHELTLLEQRRTSRLPYRADPVAPADARALEHVATQFGHRYRQLTDPAQVERILAWNVDAVFEDLNHPPYRDELRSWLRYSDAQSSRERDGLDARCMNTPPLELWLAFHASWLLTLPFTRPVFARRYRRQIGPVTTLGMLDGPFWDPRDAYGTGRFLIHFWLEVTRLGYVIHPYGNLVTNRPTAARVAKETGLDRVWLVFKIGRSSEPPLSHRRSIDEVLL